MGLRLFTPQTNSSLLFSLLSCQCQVCCSFTPNYYHLALDCLCLDWFEVHGGRTPTGRSLPAAAQPSFDWTTKLDHCWCKLKGEGASGLSPCFPFSCLSHSLMFQLSRDCVCWRGGNEGDGWELVARGQSTQENQINCHKSDLEKIRMSTERTPKW